MNRQEKFLGKITKLAVLPLILIMVLLAPYGNLASAKPVNAGQVSAATETRAETTPLIKKTAYGIFEGQEDGHTVEISVYGEAVSLQFTEQLDPYIAKLETGDTVFFTYTEQKFVNDPTVLLCHLLTIRPLIPAKPLTHSMFLPDSGADTFMVK